MMPDAAKYITEETERQKNRMIEAVWRAIVGNDTPKSEDGELIIQGPYAPITVYHFMYKGEEAAAMTIKQIAPGQFSYFVRPVNARMWDIMEKIKEANAEENGEENKIWLPGLQETGHTRTEN